MEQNALHELVRAAQTGDSQATARLMEESYQNLYYFILKTVKEKELAEDLTQDTCLHILEKLSELKEPAAYITWSRQLAYHSCADYFRKRKDLLLDETEDGATLLDTLPEEDAEFIPHEALDREDLKQTLLSMLDALPPEQRSAMLLRYYDELSVAQIAQVQAVSEGTVKSRLNYGRKAMVKQVEEYEKKNNVKLHSLSVLPLLLWLFRKQKLAAGKSFTGLTATAATVGGAAGGSSAAAMGGAAASSSSASGAALTGLKAFLGTLGGKLTAALALVLIAAVSIVLIAGNSASRNTSSKGEDCPGEIPPGAEYPSYFLEIPVDAYHSSMQVFERPAHHDPRAYELSNPYSDEDPKNYVVRLEGDELVRVGDDVYLRPVLDLDHLVKECDLPMDPAPHSFHEEGGITYCTFHPADGEPFTCEAETLEDAAVKVLEAFGPVPNCDTDLSQVMTAGTEVSFRLDHRSSDDALRLKQLLGIGVVPMYYDHTVGQGIPEKIPMPPAPTNNQVDYRRYINIEEWKKGEGAWGQITVTFRLYDMIEDYAAYLLEEIPEDHPYKGQTYWGVPLEGNNMDTAVVLINYDFQAIKLELQVPEGRNWSSWGGPRYGQVFEGGFYPGDVLHFTWKIDNEGLQLMKELLQVEFVFEDFTYEVTQFYETVEVDPSPYIFPKWRGTNGSGRAYHVEFAYPGRPVVAIDVEMPENGSYSNGDVIELDMTAAKADLACYGIHLTTDTATIIVSGLPDE